MTPASERRRWAAIDLDGYAVHLLIGEVRRGGGPGAVGRGEQRSRYLERGREPGEAGSGEAGSGEAGDAAQLVRQVGKYLLVAERARATALLAASQGLLRSPEGPALVARLEREVGLPVRSLTARREAELGFLAVRPWLEPHGPQLVIDAAATSTGLTLTAGDGAASRTVLPVGAARLAAQLPDPPGALEWALAAVRLGGLLADLPTGRPALAWATGAAAHNLVGLEDQRGVGLATRLTLADLDRLADEVLRAPSRKLARRTGEDPRRVALLAPGALILAAVLGNFGLQWCTVIPAGLRDGMILAAAELGDAWWADQAPAPAAPAPPDGGL